MAVSGDTIVVGADAENAFAGAAYVYQRDQGGADNWDEVTKLTASDAQPAAVFGVSVALSGDTAVVGAFGEDAGGSFAGAAYIFQRDQGGADNWGQVTKLTASDAEADDYFGLGVTINGDTVIVGAPEPFQGTSEAGAAYVFQRDQGGQDNWGEVKKLTASDAQDFDQFGLSITISADTVIVGAYAEDAGGDLAGAAYVFQRDQGGTDNWGEVKKLVASDAQLGDRFGGNVTISGDTAVVGACCEDTGGSNAGAAYIFQRSQGGADNRGEVKKLVASDADAHNGFGLSVAISGDTAVVGAWGEDTEANQAGAAYVFQRHQGGQDNWGEVKMLVASDAQADKQLGYSVAVSGDIVVAGAYHDNTEGLRAGAAYVFKLFQPKKLPDPGDTDGDGCSDQRENGPDETLGGQRDWLNPNDFYDVLGPGAALPIDGVIDLPNDILGVISHYAPDGAAPYDVRFDRGPSAGPNAWNMTAPDGVIDLANDILGVVFQFGHDCT